MREQLLTIFNRYGLKNQLKHFNGEVFELNEAIFNYDQDTSNMLRYNELVSEIADVTNMLCAIQYYYDISDSEVIDIMQHKIDRQLERIKNENR